VSDEITRHVLKWVRTAPALYLLVQKQLIGNERVTRCVWIYKAAEATKFLSLEDAWATFERIGVGARVDFDVRPLEEEAVPA
jgi:hypothetical protein